MVQVAKTVEIGLVLQGGGALGAYECGALAALFELMDEAEDLGRAIFLKSVSGVSIGALNGACVVGAASRNDARRRLERLWHDFSLPSPDFWPWQMQRDLSLFGLPGFYAPRMDVWAMPSWTYLYDTNPLLAALATHVDFAALNHSPIYFVTTAIDVESGLVTRFTNHPLGDDPATTIDARHILASASLPPQFPWTEIDGRIYWDGGLVDNAPLGNVIDTFSHGPDIARLIIVMDVYPLRARRPANLPEVRDRVHELSFGNHVRQDQIQARRINDMVKTIEDLASLVPAEAMTDEVRARIDRVREFKLVQVVNIDMQDPDASASPAEQHETDDEDGIRDFSPRTVGRRRAAGHRIARLILSPIFEKLGLTSGADASPTAAARS
jgi:predicted acylesterase/phospholipase RssA